MKANEDKQLEKLVDDLMKDAGLESPSVDFTSNVMSKVLASKTSEVTVYKPLISKPVFMVIFGCVLTLFIYLMMNGEKQETGWFSHLKSGLFYTNELPAVFKVSKIMVYAVVSTTIIFLVQISFLKNYFDKQLEK